MNTTSYNNRISELEILKGNSRKKINTFSIIRLFVFVLLVAIIIYLFNINVFVGVLIIPISIIFFALLIKYHSKKEEELRKHEQLINVYENEIRENNKPNIFGNGEQYINHQHLYTSDLDVFGSFSIFNMLNRTVTTEGSNTLAEWLKKSTETNKIIERQKAVKELSLKIDFKEEFLRTFFYSKSTNNVSLKNWVNNFQTYFLNKPFFKIFAWVSPIVISLSFIIGYEFHILWLLSFIFIGINMVLLTGNKVAVLKVHSYTSKQSAVYKRYARLINLIKYEEFNSDYSVKLKNELILKYNPEKEFKNIASIASRFESRYNILFQVFISPVFLWDFHISLQTEKWFVKNKKQISNWLNIIGEFDALLSVSILHFNNPDWVFAKLNNNEFNFNATQIAHPLITAKTRVASNYSINGKEKVDIITGSNMAGKSTFLRTVGVNMILAYAGAPVCAKKLELSKVEILTYFRIHDSLEESTSSFYAELKRIKDILNYIKTNNNAILFLDELLRGTNSNDRYLGSVAIVKQILKYKAIGVVATHDLKLADLEQEFPKDVRNFNFDVNVKDDELFFDYKLKTGICQSFNATLLMKKIGIEM